MATAVPWREQFQETATRLAQPVESLRQLLGDIAARAVAAVGAAAGSVLVLDDDGKHLRFLVSTGPGSERLRDLRIPLDSIAGHAFSTNTMMAFGDLHAEKGADSEEEIALQPGGAVHAYLAIPILHNGRSHGVATYVNRTAPPLARPFQPDEMEKARSYSLLESAILRHLERLRQLDRFGAYDLAVAWVALDPQGPSPTARPDLRGHVEPWARVLGQMEQLGQEDQDFCADLVSFVARRRNWEVG
jgi:hypothetical protein